MPCNLCNKDDVEFEGRKKVCNECQIIVIESNKTIKTCEYCGQDESIKLFSLAKKGIICKDCIRDYTLDQKMIRHKLTYKEYYENNRDKMTHKSREWNKNNKDKRAVAKKNYREKHKNEINFRIKENLSTRLRNLIRKDGHCVIDFLDCSIEFFKEWLRYNFKEGMSFENYGSFWHIDHAKACALYDFSKQDDVKECWNWSNLVPLEKTQNEKKGSKLDMEYIEYYKKRRDMFLDSLTLGEGSETKWLSAEFNLLKI